VRRILTLALASGLALAIVPAPLHANGGSVDTSSSSATTSMDTPTPEQLARQAYNNGIDHRDKAKKLEDQAATQQGKDHDNSLNKAKDEFTKALKEFQNAAKLDPTLYQAYNGMGYAYRKTGDYAKALENYDQALKMAPGFADAIEYRGEAYLGLNRIDDARQAYMDLFSKDRKQADQLLTAMSAWVTAHQSGVQGVDPAAIASFDAWIKDRAKIAQTTVAMAISSDRSIWK
jgi:tetratricopeptide (TPR) repeat protein